MRRSSWICPRSPQPSKGPSSPSVLVSWGASEQFSGIETGLSWLGGQGPSTSPGFQSGVCLSSGDGTLHPFCSQGEKIISSYHRVDSPELPLRLTILLTIHHLLPKIACVWFFFMIVQFLLCVLPLEQDCQSTLHSFSITQTTQLILINTY